MKHLRCNKVKNVFVNFSIGFRHTHHAYSLSYTKAIAIHTSNCFTRIRPKRTIYLSCKSPTVDQNVRWKNSMNFMLTFCQKEAMLKNVSCVMEKKCLQLQTLNYFHCNCLAKSTNKINAQSSNIIKYSLCKHFLKSFFRTWDRYEVWILAISSTHVSIRARFQFVIWYFYQTDYTRIQTILFSNRNTKQFKKKKVCMIVKWRIGAYSTLFTETTFIFKCIDTAKYKHIHDWKK